MPAQGGQSPTGPQFAQASAEAIRLCSDSSSELDFKMIENAQRNVVNCFNMLLPYAENMQQFVQR